MVNCRYTTYAGGARARGSAIGARPSNCRSMGSVRNNSRKRCGRDTLLALDTGSPSKSSPSKSPLPRCPSARSTVVIRELLWRFPRTAEAAEVSRQVTIWSGNLEDSDEALGKRINTSARTAPKYASRFAIVASNAGVFESINSTDLSAKHDLSTETRPTAIPARPQLSVKPSNYL
jgi:hypothetical protein